MGVSAHKPAWRGLAFGLSCLLVATMASVAAGTDRAAAAVPPDCTASSPQSVITTTGDATLVATFNNPIAHGGVDEAQLHEMIRLINCTPSTGSIRMAIHSITANIVYRAIKAAHDRGVTVQIVDDGSEQSSGDSTPRDLHALLGSNHHWCDHGSDGSLGWGCISTDGSGIMHSKYAMFSKTMDPNGTTHSNVVWFGSPNLTYASGSRSFNDAITVYGDKSLYDGFEAKIWAPMWREDRYAGNDFYCASCQRGTFHSSNSNIKVYASPEQTTDLVVNRLNYIHPGSDCHLHVMESMIHDSRSAVVDKLVSLRNKGCSVKVTASQINSDALASFVNNGIPVHQAPVHNKLILFHGRYAKVDASRYIIFTGSHNLTYSALRRNDELLVKVNGNSKAFFDAFYRHFHDAYNAGTPCSATSC